MEGRNSGLWGSRTNSVERPRLLKETAVAGVTPGGTLRLGLHHRERDTWRGQQTPDKSNSDQQRAPRRGKSPTGSELLRPAGQSRTRDKPPGQACPGRAASPRAAGPGDSPPAARPQAARPPPAPKPAVRPAPANSLHPTKHLPVPLLFEGPRAESQGGPPTRLTEPEAGDFLREKRPRSPQPSPTGATENVQRFNGPQTLSAVEF